MNLIKRIQMSYDDSYDYFDNIVHKLDAPKWQEFLFDIIYPNWYKDIRYEEWNDFYRAYTNKHQDNWIGNDEHY